LSNILFVQFANLISDMQIRQSEDAVDIPELEPIHLFLSKNIPNTNRKRKVLRESVTVDKNGKIFLIECILFLDNSYEISINDISRQEEESRMKRQLTQNVAHELKTPVSSIQGYLETIISNPQLPDDKRQFFLERCYSQSTRLTGLLRDISVLNRLDEASEMFELSEVNIQKLVGEGAVASVPLRAGQAAKAAAAGSGATALPSGIPRLSGPAQAAAAPAADFVAGMGPGATTYANTSCNDNQIIFIICTRSHNFSFSSNIDRIHETIIHVKMSRVNQF
jgi:hypothetical protein